MHPITISPEVLERLAARGPRASILSTLEPSRTAHLVIDLQRGYMAPGAIREVPSAREIVGNVNTIASTLRSAGGTVVFLRMNLATSGASWRTFIERLLDPDIRARTIAAFSPGSSEFALWDDLDVAPGDLIVDKTRFGAFVPGASDLHSELTSRGIDTVIVTGTLSNICCESTARDAMQMDYRVVFVSDANATYSDAAHSATLDNMAGSFADTPTSAEVVAAIMATRAQIDLS